jgi:hypothetical protein
MVRSVSLDGQGIRVGTHEHSEARVIEALGEAAGSAEKVDRRRFWHRPDPLSDTGQIGWIRGVAMTLKVNARSS